MQICYNQATGKDCSTLEADLELCEQAGFDFIEMRTDMLRDYLARNSLDDLKRFFASNRLKPHTLDGFYLYPEFLGEHDDPARRQALLDEFLMGLLVSKEIGIHYAVVVPPLIRDPKGPPYPGKWEDTRRECVRILRRLSDIARFYEVRLCFEMVGFKRCGVRSIADAAVIVEEVDRDNVGYVFDSYNLYVYDQSNDFSAIRSVDPEKIFIAHINNADAAPESEMGQDKRRFCDHGILDLGNFLENLKTAGYDGMLSIETFRPEYYAREPEWVIREAYRTTREAMERYEVW
ncbi:MAG: sugar phosphate isomerase/epimerase [Planctomycetes bacterium]|nr:sugar phosphate isomerase/epimerase [Planctomycetota bacterium]